MEIEKSSLYQKEASRFAVITEASKLRSETESDVEPRSYKEDRPHHTQENNPPPPPMSTKHITQAPRLFGKEGSPLSPHGLGNVVVTPSAAGKGTKVKFAIKPLVKAGAKAHAAPVVKMDLQRSRVKEAFTVSNTIERKDSAKRTITPTRKAKY